MGKRPETIFLENCLHAYTKKERIYGCEEVTIGFANGGKGNEIVDFMTMDSKGVLKCYEIKVTLQDLKSRAKKSWYGHYNYLVITKELYDEVQDWDEFIPKGIGLIIGGTGYFGTLCLNSMRRASLKELTPSEEIMLKESMIRSMFYKMSKYKDATDPDEIRKRNKKESELKQENVKLRYRAETAENIISDYEYFHQLNTGESLDLKEMAKAEKETWKENIRKARQ